MEPRELFEANLAVIERATARVCRDAGLHGADAEDFASSVKLALLLDDCAILRKFEGRSSFATYITIVIRRLLADQRRASGRWFASAEAQRRGEAAVALERLLWRDQRSLAESIAIVHALHPEVSTRALEEIARALPERAPRPRLVAIGDEDEERFAGPAAADERIDALDRERRAGQASRAVRDAMAAMSAEDRVVLRLRFGKGVTIADIARVLGVAQRPLYRRIEALLGTLRAALERAGIGYPSVADLIGAADERLQFDLDEGKNDATHPSLPDERERSGES
jgi:RNA polymerase sigma factor (sigma-70 family)